MASVKKIISKNKFLILFIIAIIVLLTLYPVIHSYLSCTKRVKADLLLVEGWLGSNALEAAYNEFNSGSFDKMIASGIKLVSHEYYLMSQNGYLIFFPGQLPGDSSIMIHSFVVNAYGQLGEENASRFNFYVNDSLVDEFITDKSTTGYRSYWNGRLDDVDSLMIQFTNDATGDFGDRNLYVKDILIDGKYSVPYKFNSIYDISEPGGNDRFVNDYKSYADLAAKKLFSLGLDSSDLIIISGENVKVNRTLSSALAVEQWVETNSSTIEGINIVSEGIHARRTWLTYKKVLGGNYTIGIISFPENDESVNYGKKLLFTYSELLNLFYYWIILLQY